MEVMWPATLSCVNYLGKDKRDLLEQRQGAILGRFHTCNAVYMVSKPYDLCLNDGLSFQAKNMFLTMQHRTQ